MERVFAASKAEAPPNAIRHTSCEYEIKLIDTMYSSILSTYPLHTNNDGCGKERRMFIGPW